MATAPATAEEFVIAWQGSETVFGLAKELDVNINTVSTRAKVYRRKGIPLKTFKPIRHPRGLKFKARASSGVVGQHRSRRGIRIPLLNIKALTRLAKREFKVFKAFSK